MVPANILQQVITWNMADLEIFQNLCPFVYNANTKFKNFEDFRGKSNLGSTVNYETPPRFVGQESLVVNFQSIQQNARSLTVNKQENVSYAGTAEQIVFNNLEEYTVRLGASAMAELASRVERDVATLAETIPYRFFGNGTSPIASAQQLSQMLSNMRAYSMAPGSIDGYLDSQAIPAIVGAMQNQFTIDRNNENARSWMVGNWDGAEWYVSNQLPIHFAGNVGNLAQTLTVISTNDPTGNNITQITFSGASTSDADAIKQFDSMQFVKVSGQRLLTWLQYVGHGPTSLAVQMSVTADAGSDSSGHVTVNIFPPLCATAGSANQNIQFNVTAGMQVQVLPDHKCGMAIADKALYVAMPPLPNTMPFPSATAVDENTMVSVRLYYGVIPFQNVYGWTRDIIWGKDAVPQNTMKIVIPLTAAGGLGA